MGGLPVKVGLNIVRDVIHTELHQQMPDGVSTLCRQFHGLLFASFR